MRQDNSGMQVSGSSLTIKLYNNNNQIKFNMKKLLLFVVALSIAVPGFAQSDDGEDEFIPTIEKSNAFFFGIKAGGTMTTMTQPNEGKLYDGSDFGYSGGLVFMTRFGKASENSTGGTGYFSTGIELKYVLNSVKTLGIDENGDENAKLSVGYFEVPVFVHIHPLAKSTSLNSLYVELGAAFAGTISRSPKSLTLYNPSADYSQVTYNLDTNGSKLKGMDVRPLAGIGYTIPNTGLDINARYYIGTSELAGNFPCKMNTLEVSLAWLFNIGKF